jgi:hypothetical protein
MSHHQHGRLTQIMCLLPSDPAQQHLLLQQLQPFLLLLLHTMGRGERQLLLCRLQGFIQEPLQVPPMAAVRTQWLVRQVVQGGSLGRTLQQQQKQWLGRQVVQGSSSMGRKQQQKQ